MKYRVYRVSEIDDDVIEESEAVSSIEGVLYEVRKMLDKGFDGLEMISILVESSTFMPYHEKEGTDD